MKSYLISGISNQIPSTDEIMPDLNHSGIYNKQSNQQTLAWESIFESCGARMSDNEQSQQREENANNDLEENNIQANWCVR